MRILAIRGENLASLATQFEIDLTSEPLAGTGLFAITGDTGAGKSTILDALCVALYGEYPRVAVEQREHAPDPSGHPITARDARGLLRRGASEGYAEVDFVGQDGESYRVRWRVARARGKASGRLQAEQRLLTRLADGTAIADGIRPVREAVEARTGLTFDQFRRTVLLAQGEFDAFLLADENDRADLLEKITGTNIYARISMRVNAETKARAGEIELLEARRQQLGLLSTEDRDALAVELTAGHAERDRLIAAHAVASAALAHGEMHARALHAVEAAEQALAKARIAEAEAAPERAQLERLAAAEPLRTPIEAVRVATERLDAAVQQSAKAAGALDTCRTAAEAAETAFGTAVTLAEAAENDCAAFTPIWQAASALDIEIAAATDELEKARTALAEAQRLQQSAQAEHRALCARLHDLRQALAATRGELEVRKFHAELADRADEIAARLSRQANLIGQRRTALDSSLQAAGEYEALTARLKAAKAGIERELLSRRAIEDQTALRRQALAAIDAHSRAAEDARLASLQDIVRQARSMAASRDEAELRLAQALANADDASAAATAGKLALDSAENAHRDARTERRALDPLVDLAAGMSGAAASGLRHVLLDGEPCPVCGSKAHPFASPDHPEARMIVAVRQRREDIDARIDGLRKQITDASGALAAANARNAHAAQARKLAETGIASANSAFSAIAHRLEAAHLGSRCKARCPAALDAGASGLLAALEREADARREEHKAPLAAAQQLRKEIDEHDAEMHRLARSIDTAEAEIKGIDTALRQAERARDEAQSQLGRTDDLLASHGLELAGPLTAAGLTLADLDHDPIIAGRAMQSLGEQYADLRRKADHMDAELRRNEPELMKLESLLATTLAEATKATGEAETRSAVLQDKRSRRAALLGGEDTSAHRARIEKARNAAAAQCENARELRSKAQTDHAVASETLRQAKSKLEDAGTALAQAQDALAAALQQSGLTREEAEQLIATPAPSRIALRERLTQLTRAVETADAALKTRRDDLEASAAAGEQDFDVAAARALLGALADDLEKSRNAVARFEARIEADEVARADATDLGRIIGEKQRSLKIWQDVDSAVGSPDGARFRRFAQSITLDQLVRLANEQLAALKPRYRLQRGSTSALALQVVDSELGDEARTLRSLSGGERFLVSLALALALSGLEGRQSFVDTLFIDEGFGSLDAETLDVAIDALESLQGRGRKVGVITHVAGMIDRIAVQLRVERRGNGRSRVRLVTAVDRQPAGTA